MLFSPVLLSKYLRSLLFCFLLLTTLITGWTSEVYSSTVYETYRDNEFSYQLNIPRHWFPETKNQSVVFSGDKGSQEWNTTLNV
jgi:hypothetical protein